MYFSYLKNLRRSLHQIPELGYHEVQTAALIKKELQRLGVHFTSGIAKTGIVATMGSGKGPRVMFRADMDGLPIEEKNSLPYRSKHKGIMHACGHDGHMAVLLGLARAIKENAAKFHGIAVLVFQPAEEGGAGAKLMIEAGVLKKYKPDSYFSFHLANDKPLGEIGARPGLQQAGARRFSVTFRGPGGHAGYLSKTRDVIKAARGFCASLENLGREMFPWHKTPIVHVGVFHAGTAPNAVAHEAVVKGTMRVQEKADLDKLQRAIIAKAKYSARLDGLLAPMCEFGGGYIPLVNDPETTTLVESVARKEKFKFKILPLHAGADDAAFFLEKIPGCHFKVGAAKHGATPHHSPGFDFDERAMEVALQMYLGLAREFMMTR